MNSDTRMPAAARASTLDARALPRPAASRPPSVVSSLAPLGHEANGVRRDGGGDLHHGAGRRHLEVERYGQQLLQPAHVLVADMAAILAQMRGDAVRAGFAGPAGPPAPGSG